MLHGLVPPHPGPLVAIDALQAPTSACTLLFGLICAIPCRDHRRAGVRQLHQPRGLDLPRPRRCSAAGENVSRRGETGGGRRVRSDRTSDGDDRRRHRTPATGAAGTAVDGAAPRRLRRSAPTIATVLLPVVLMLLRAIGELTLDEGNGAADGARRHRHPVDRAAGRRDPGDVHPRVRRSASAGRRSPRSLGGSLPADRRHPADRRRRRRLQAGARRRRRRRPDRPTAAEGANISALVLGWLVAVGIRLATGSATVATITAAGIVAPLAAGLDSPTVALLALAIGAGSLFFSHVNDAGFWLVKEYFGMTVGQTIKSWSVMETIISVVGLLGVLLLYLVV